MARPRLDEIRHDWRPGRPAPILDLPYSTRVRPTWRGRRPEPPAEGPMDAADAMIAAVALSIVTTLALTFGIGWFRAARRVRELERQILGAAPDAPVAHLEATVGDLADRVEELTDGQDFLSRLLAERREPPPGPRALPELPTPR